MRVWLDSSVLAANYLPEISAILALGYLGRHRVMPVDGVAYAAWLKLFDAVHREMYQFVWDDSLSREAAGRATHEVFVCKQSSGSGGPGRKILSPTKSVELLLHPFRLVLENTWSDWQFLLRMATPEERQRLEELFEKGWLVTSGGGQGELTKEVRRLCCGFEGAMRTAAFFDSDARVPNQISDGAQLAKTACADILFHCLSRRAIENYLPLESLRRWAQRGSSRNERQQRMQLVSALAELKKLDCGRRDCFPMKTGYGQNMPIDLDAEQWLPLRSGFGKCIAELFDNDTSVTEDDLRSDGGFGEVNPFVKRLITAAR